MEHLLDVHPAAQTAQESFHADFITQVKAAIAQHKVVVVGMAWNQPVKRARRYLASRNIAYHYLEHGNYVSGWKRRLALKMWARWPTYPMVFIKGTLVGGARDLAALGRSGELDRLLA